MHTMQKKSNTRISILKNLFYIIVLEILLTFFLFISIEGSLSWYHFFRDIYRNRNIQINNNIHTQYDSLLGWKNIPNTFIPDIFGTNNNLTITADGFRKTPINPANQTLKTICSGDSFTFGYGVDDAKNWCSLLSNDYLQTINMGQAGYGLDQTYLWYQRDAENISHTIHIMAFIPDDFDRVSKKEYFGYGKPYFKIKNGKLYNINHPVPINQNLGYFISKNLEIFNNLHLYQTITHIKEIIFKYIYPISNISDSSDPDTIVTALLEDLFHLTRERGATPLIILLPTKYSSDTKNENIQKYNKWKNLLTRITQKNNILFIDMGEIFLRYNTTDYLSLFLKNDLHYSEETNLIVANNIKTVLNQHFDTLFQSQNKSLNN